MSDAIFYAVVAAFGIVGLFTLYVMFVIMPYALYTDMKCKEAGYPKSEVTVNLKGYCMTLDGAVTIKMEAL